MKASNSLVSILHVGVGGLALVTLLIGSGCASRNNQTRILESRRVIPAPYETPVAMAVMATPAAPVVPAYNALNNAQTFQPVQQITAQANLTQPNRPTSQAPALPNYQPPPIEELDTVSAPRVTTTAPLPPSPAKTAPSAPPAVKTPEVPAKTAAAETETGDNCLKYTVKRGDTLSAIAKTHGMSTSELALFNKLDANGVLRADATLLIPKKDGLSATSGARTLPAAVATTPATSGQTYKVEKGDSLWAIAKSFGLGTSELAQYNNRDVNAVLVEGTTLRLPPHAKINSGASTSKSAGSAKPMVASVPAKHTGTYTVQKGDSLSVVAHRYDMSLSELKELNGLSTDVIQVGQVLKVIGSPKAPSVSSKSSSKPSSSAPKTVVAAATTPSTGALAPTLLTANPGSGPSTVPAVNTPGVVKHTVKPNDNLWVIARQYKVSSDRIRELNGLKNDNLFPGMVLVVQDDSRPAGSAAPSASVPAAAPAPIMASATASQGQGSLITATTVTKPSAGGHPAAVQTVPMAVKSTTLSPEQVLALQQLPHTVESGDTLQLIASMYSTEVEWIKVANPSIKSDADLKTVTTIKVPLKMH